jgi:hypothetical protein
MVRATAEDRRSGKRHDPEAWRRAEEAGAASIEKWRRRPAAGELQAASEAEYEFFVPDLGSLPRYREIEAQARELLPGAQRARTRGRPVEAEQYLNERILALLDQCIERKFPPPLSLRELISACLKPRPGKLEKQGLTEIQQKS